jgi:hypothetical protein
MARKIIRHWRYSLLGLLVVALIGVLGFQAGASSRPQLVLHNPAEDDLVVVNGCVVSACQYLASVRSHHQLDRHFWSRVMLVRYEGVKAGHAYCVWETDGQIFGYDRNGGAFPIPGKVREPKAIATALAGELGKVLKRDMQVARAEFIEPGETATYEF